MVQSVRPPVCPSVTPFWQCSGHHIIMKFSEVIAIGKRDVHTKGQGHGSNVRSHRSKPNLTISGLYSSSFEFTDGFEMMHKTWWRHQIETFSALLAICAGNSPVPGEFPTQRPVTRSFDVYFDLRPNKRLSKQPWGWWFETLSCSLWRHRNELDVV